jgi:predicted ABC-type ATPase
VFDIEQSHRVRHKPIVYVTAGPNGSGKTTFVTDFLPALEQGFEFVNADCIAFGLSPFAPDRAAFEEGGHSVPDVDVRRRYAAGLRNFFSLYRSLADFVTIIDNSGEDPQIVAKGAGLHIRCVIPEIVADIERAAGLKFMELNHDSSESG